MKIQKDKDSLCENTVASDLDMASAIGNIDADSLSSVGTRFIEDSDAPKSSDLQLLGNSFTMMNSFANLLCSPMPSLSRDLSATAIVGYPRSELTSDDQGHQSYTRRKQQDQVFPAAFNREYDCPPQMLKKPRLANKHGDPLSEHNIYQLLKKGDPVQWDSHQFHELVMQHKLQYQQQHNLRSTQQLPIVAAQQQQHQNQRQHLCQELEPQFSCHQRVMQYQYHIRLRPHEHNIAYWRDFVSQYYFPGARKRWCLSSYEKLGEHSLSIFSRAARPARHCDICGSNSGKGFEANFEVLPRLLKTKFESGVIDELLYLNSPREFKLPSGLMVLTYGRAVQESVYEQFRVVREGQLRIVFRPDFKILSWELCLRKHEEFVARSSIAPKVNQLVQTAAATADRYSRISPQDLLSDCNSFIMAGQRLTRSLEFLLVNDLGFSKSFVRCLQTAEVANSMKDLIHFSHYNNIGPIESLHRYCEGGDPTKKTYNAAQVPPTATGMGKSITDSVRNKPKRNMPNQSSRGSSSKMSSPLPSPQSSGPRKVQGGSPLSGFLISQLSRMDQKSQKEWQTEKLEMKEQVLEEFDRNAASARGLQMPASSSSSYPPSRFFNAMDLTEAIRNMDKGLFGDGILENDSTDEA
ncbi:probable transcriptional regulator SLK2 [Impatiens glandulifera]|uniref:probable transcriptional regulator SLK2 n=1 Tax=Impatiens glandulifera TaxID=253017 RepID=UPI001FB05D1E|nr:probable transcriptional regulator SLK2 [Impatiens glandulifera]